MNQKPAQSFLSTYARWLLDLTENLSSLRIGMQIAGRHHIMQALFITTTTTTTVP